MQLGAMGRHPGKALAGNTAPLAERAKANGRCGNTKGKVCDLQSEELGEVCAL